MGMGIVTRVLAGALAIFASNAQAQQDYPNRPIHAVVGFPAGGGADIIARYFAAQLEKVSGKTFIVDNKPGNNSNLAVSLLVKARPDGYTTLFGSSSTLVGGRYFVKDIPFDVMKDLTPVRSFIEGSFILVVGPNTPANDVPSLVAWLKSRPQNRFGYSNQLGLLAGQYFQNKAGINAVSVAYKSGPDAAPDLVAGSLEYMVMDGTFASGQIKAGKVKAIAATTSTRYPEFANIPLMKEYPGFEDADFTTWWALYVPNGTPKPITDKLGEWMGRVTASPETAAYLGAIANIPLHEDGAATTKRIEREIARWEPLVKAAGIEPQ
jgi:tripartite-type tricarboxylate transporter receptor subunit TctC